MLHVFQRDEEETEKVLQDFEKDFGGVTHASSGKGGGQVRKVRRKQSVFGSDQEDESEEDCRQAEQKVHINPEVCRSFVPLFARIYRSM